MQPSKVHLRIVAGNLRGRKISAVVHEDLRPTPQMVREALFSILGNAVPGRPFFDVFAGTGVIGLEAISRGASEAIFVEYDAKLANAIDNRLREFEIQRSGHVLRADVYRWAEALDRTQVAGQRVPQPPVRGFDQSHRRLSWACEIARRQGIFGIVHLRASRGRLSG